jgi:uncharacterized membrane protein YhaH (DUF805 family)
VTFINAIKFGFKNYFNFSGVVDRPKFWYWILFLVIAFTVLSTVPVMVPVFFSAIACPTTALMIRRLRDAGESVNWMYLWFIPLLVIGPAMSTVFSAMFNGPDGQAWKLTGIVGLGIFFLFVVAIVMVAIIPVLIFMVLQFAKPTRK